jgi:hypothetical protein
MGCGYEIGGLDASGPCPECGRPIAQTLALRLGRESPKHLVRFVWGFWLSAVSGMVQVVMVLAVTTGLAEAVWALVWGGSGRLRIDDWMIGSLVSVLLLAQGAGVLLMMGAARWAARARKLATAAIVAWLFAHACGVGLWLMIDDRISLGSGRWDEGVVVGLATLGLGSMFCVLTAGPRALARWAMHLNRFALVPQLARFVVLSTLWHGLGLVMLQGAIIAAWLELDGLVNVAGWMTAVVFGGFGLGSVGWCLYLVVTQTRVLAAVGGELRAARVTTAGGRT